MQRMLKFNAPLDAPNPFTISMPIGSEILHLAVQRDIPRIWAAADEEQGYEGRTFCWRGTGHAIPEKARHVGTVLVYEGSLVFHLFELES